ncbi:MAG: RNA polymerase sigma factor [Bacteroidales bacterium]|nr:RNA polymerase sigma factor [Lentimicrobiaceae bacterium]MBQ2907748.1 RNA polymerase sigma factor [Bacteroidales bacterium]MBQ3594270.1 RNA polymerase sigma factor [Bacteroidales bacterium]MBR3915210.1 RNA polymerase sigma factor [Bacteroidales bacterium]
MDLKDEFVELVTRYKDVIFKVCYIYAEKDDIEDYYQEVLIQIWRSLPKFRGESKVTTWIYRISLNTCISHVRKNTKGNINKVPLIDVNLWENDIEKKQQVDEMYSLINKLNKLEKAVILLWLEDRDYEEIASVVGITKANVAVKINRIKEKLRKLSNQ